MKKLRLIYLGLFFKVLRLNLCAITTFSRVKASKSMGVRLGVHAGLAAALCLPGITPFVHEMSVAAAESPESVLINEIKPGGGEDEALKEYVTLFNAGAASVSLDGWLLEYAKPAFDSQFCAAPSWQTHASGIVVSVTELSGTLPAQAVTAPIIRQLNDTGAGAMRLVDSTNPDQVVVHDVVGWGADAPCKETAPTQTPTINKSLIRYKDCTAHVPVDTNHNSADFATDQIPRPGTLGDSYTGECATPTPDTNCQAVAITEVFPNPAGVDTAKEFIELHNPTEEDVALTGCSLGVTGSNATHMFAASDRLRPGEYRVFYDHATGLSLPNAGGGEVLLIWGANETVVSYPANMKDGIAWAFIATQWQATDNPTPGAVNKPTTPEPVGGMGGDQKLAACPAGKFRNPETNRCKTSVTVAGGLAPCQSGQTRNPSTNRCRSVVLAASSLVPCKEGQERNPSTNRCRSTLSASTVALAPCKAGYERNPETNRCRKAASAAGTAATIHPGQSEGGAASSKFNVIALGLVAAAAASYGAYEYRNDLRSKLLQAKARVFPGQSGK